MCDHTTADDAKRYQPPQEVEAHKKEDPILRLRTYLASQNLWNEEQENALYARIKQTVEQAVHNYESIPNQPPTAIFDYLYATLPHELVEQRDILLANLGEHHGEMTLVEAVTQAMAYELAHDQNVMVFGEDVGANGGVFRATKDYKNNLVPIGY